jgi:hypothetical protein
MKGLKVENQRDDPSRSRDAQEIDALKTLEDPPHSRSSRWLVDLVGKGLTGLGQLSPQAILSEAIDRAATAP